MSESIYFSKIEFREYIGCRLKAIVLINIVEGTLAYQVYGVRKSNKIRTNIDDSTDELIGNIYDYETGKHVVRMKNSKNGFKPVQIEGNNRDCDIIYSYTHKFTDDEKNELLLYCNALDYEPYRNKKMSMEDEGYLGYRDEVSAYFTGVTDSYLPIIRLSMDYYYDEKHIWPSEKLYNYITKKNILKKTE